MGSVSIEGSHSVDDLNISTCPLKGNKPSLGDELGDKSAESCSDVLGEGFDPSVEMPITSDVVKAAKSIQRVYKYSTSPLGFLVVLCIFAIIVLALFFPSVNLSLAAGTLEFHHLLIVAPVLIFEIIKMSYLRYLKTNALSTLADSGYQYKGSWFVVSDITGHVYSLDFIIYKDNCC